MKWIKNNVGWFATLVGLVFLVSGWATGIFGTMLETGARNVYEEKVPEMEAVVDHKIQVHELRMEPRLQSIEHEVTEQRKVSADSLEVQKETLEVLKELRDQ